MQCLLVAPFPPSCSATFFLARAVRETILLLNARPTPIPVLRLLPATQRCDILEGFRKRRRFILLENKTRKALADL